MKFMLKALAFAAVLAAGQANAQTADDDAKTIADGFAAMDTDKDGSISRPEFEAYMKAYLADQRASFDEGFNEIDTNKDGKLSPEEAEANTALSANFGQIDENEDGFLSKDELASAFAAASKAETKE